MRLNNIIRMLGLLHIVNQINSQDYLLLDFEKFKDKNDAFR